MKSVLLTVCLLTSLASEARDVKIVVLREPASAVELTGFSEALYGKKVKTCFSGASNQVCSEVKTSIKRANKDLTEAGAAQRFSVVTCAQNPNRAMVIYSLRPARESAQKLAPKARKTVFIDRCADESQPQKQQIALSLSN